MAQKNDPLAGEVSLKAKITDSSVDLRAKSRLVSGFDRLGGNLAELLNAPMERRSARIRGEAKIIEEATEAAVARIRASPELADHIILNRLESTTRKRNNHAEVLVEALEDLSARPPTKEQAESGPEILSDEFLDRHERYAEDASTEELRVKWGKVLAAEVRQPGRISRRTMRAIDELPPAVALRFEQLCRYRLDKHLIKGLTGELSFEDASALTFYGLILDPGLTGKVALFSPTTSGDSRWFYVAGNRAVGLPRNAKLFPADSKLMLWHEAGTPAMPVYALTDVGFELSSIFEDQTQSAWNAFLTALAAEAQRAGGYEITFYSRVGDQYFKVGSVNVAGEQPGSDAPTSG